MDPVNELLDQRSKILSSVKNSIVVGMDPENELQQRAKVTSRAKDPMVVGTRPVKEDSQEPKP